MPKGQYGLPSLYGQQHGRMTFGAVMNPFQQQGAGGERGTPPPQPPFPPGTHQTEPPRQPNALPNMQGQTPFTAGASPTGGGGAWYTPTPGNSITAGYAYRPRQMPGDTNVDTSSAAYRQSMGAFAPSGDNQALWDVLPVQYKLTLSQWAAAGAGAYSSAYLDAMRAGATGVIIDGKYMSGNDAAAYIKSKADAYMAQIAQARQQNQPRPEPTPFRIGV